jgi:RNA-binding protein
VKGRRGKELRATGQTLTATLFVGDSGVTPAVASEAAAQLKARELIKAKVSGAAADAKGMKAVGEELAALAGAELVEVRGRTALIARRARASSEPPRPEPKAPRARPRSGAVGARRRP